MGTWSKITECPNYEVSKNGEIRRGNHIKTPIEHNGYYTVDLYSNGKRIKRRISRLVAQAFIPNPDGLPDVNHKDGNKLNNSVENLEWVTKSENMQHAIKNGLWHPSYGMLGKKNPNGGRKSKPFRIVETGQVFNKLLEADCDGRFTSTKINDCLKGRQKTHRGYHFEYV